MFALWCWSTFVVGFSVFTLTLIPVSSQEVVAFTDTSIEGSLIDGLLQIRAAADEASISRYSVHFAATADGPTGSEVVATIPVSSPSSLSSRQVRTRLPVEFGPGAHFFLVVYAHVVGNGTTGMRRGLSLRCRDAAVPTERARSLIFRDGDSRPGVFGGEARIGRASNEGNVESYVIHSAANEATGRGVRRWRFIERLGRVGKAAVVVREEDADVCRCSLLKEGHSCAAPSSLLPGSVSVTDCAERCEQSDACQYFVTGSPGTARVGRCYLVAGACTTFKVASDYNSFNLTLRKESIHGLGEQGSCRCGLVPGKLVRSLVPAEPILWVPLGTPTRGATHIVVVTENQDGDMTQSQELEKWTSTPFLDLGLRFTAVLNLSFVDMYQQPGRLQGDVIFKPPSGHVLDFNVYLSSIMEGSVQRLLGGKPLTVRTVGEQFRVPLGAECSGEDVCVGIPEPLLPEEEGTNGGANASNDTNVFNESNTGNASLSVRHTEMPICSCSPGRATHILVLPVSSAGEVQDAGKAVKLVDRTGLPPVVSVQSMKFIDTDDNPNLIGGRVVISVSQPEPQDVAAYRLYFQDEYGERVKQVRRGGRADWIGEVAATGFHAEIEIPMGTIIPPGAERLALVAVNADGEGPLVRGTAIRDIGSGSGEFHAPILEVVLIVGLTCGCFLVTAGWLLLRTRCKNFLVKMWQSELEKKNMQESRR